ncbi:MAG: hypothetical protein EOP47_11970 [Sphingobacteriaceae bacterium]|nr:MAG: hypothetical protein EOP47_11970 [Sphingobacteriaceae bacterium]
MISIIISSVNNDELLRVSDNVAATIGVPYEIIATDNSKGEKGLCEVYNAAAMRAQYDVLCFMHEDIILKTENWGTVLNDIFNNNPEVGLVGVVGGSYKSIAPSGWGGQGVNHSYCNIIQSFKYEKKQDKFCYRNPNRVKLQHVASIDGVFMCTTKKVFATHKFDEASFKGFHVYDIDFSLNIGQHYKVAVTYDILLNHLSEGKYNQVWMEDNLKLHQKWNSYLPVDMEGFDFKKSEQIEKATFKYFIRQLPELGMSVNDAFKVLYYNNRFKKLYTKLYWKLHYYILKSWILGR